jgi:hypothetical protein
VQAMQELVKLLPSFDVIAVAGANGVKLTVPYYTKSYTFRPVDKDKVHESKVINFLRVRLINERWHVAVYELKEEPLVYLIEMWKDRGKKTFLEMLRLRYYSFGKETPDEELLGYIKVGSYSIISLITEKQASLLIEKLIKDCWRVDL